MSAMLLYLLLPLLISGFVESQTGNTTDENSSKVEGKLKQLGNQTWFGPCTKNDSTMGAADLYKDKLSEVEGELRLDENETLTVITEDDERFQDQEHELTLQHCNKNLLLQYGHGVCGEYFHQTMLNMTTESWCVLENIIRPYNEMTLCLEKVSVMVGCYYPNSNIQEFFLYIHSLYFQNCSKEEELFVDAPHSLVVALTLIPVSLIPVLVFLVIWRSKVQD